MLGSQGSFTLALVSVAAALGSAGLAAASRQLLARGALPVPLTLADAYAQLRVRTYRYLSLMQAANKAIAASIGLLAAITALSIPLLNQHASGLIRAGFVCSLADVVAATLAAGIGVALGQAVSSRDVETLDAQVTAGLQFSHMATMDRYATTAYWRLATLVGVLLIVGLGGLASLILLAAGQWSA